MTAPRYVRPEAKSATVGWSGVIQSILDAPGTQRSAQRNSATAAGLALNPREHTVCLPPPHIEVAALHHQGQFGLPEHRRKARKISSGIANNWPARIRSLIGR